MVWLIVLHDERNSIGLLIIIRMMMVMVMMMGMGIKGKPRAVVDEERWIFRFQAQQ